MDQEKYLKAMIGKLYKLLPLAEEKNEYLDDYIGSLYLELVGSCKLFPELGGNTYYASIICTVASLNKWIDNFKVYRREVLKSIHLVEDIQKGSGWL